METRIRFQCRNLIDLRNSLSENLLLYLEGSCYFVTGQWLSNTQQLHINTSVAYDRSENRWKKCQQTMNLVESTTHSGQRHNNSQRNSMSKHQATMCTMCRQMDALSFYPFFSFLFPKIQTGRSSAQFREGGPMTHFIVVLVLFIAPLYIRQLCMPCTFIENKIYCLLDLTTILNTKDCEDRWMDILYSLTQKCLDEYD